MRILSLSLPFILTLFVACKKVGIVSFFNGKKSSDEANTSSLKQGDRPSDSSGSVPGYFNLGCKISFSDDGFGVETACALADQNGKVSLPTISNSWSWQYAFGEDASQKSFIAVTELPQENPYHVLYRFSGLNREALLNMAFQAKYSLKLQLKGDTKSQSIQETIDKKMAMSAAPRFRFVRISFPSLKQPWPDTREMDIEGLELKWEDQWRQGSFTDYTGRIGPYEVTVSASSFSVDRNSFPYYAFKRSQAGDIWETAFDTYEDLGDFNAVGAPQWLKIDFKDHPVAIQAIKIDGGDSVDTPGSEGAPDAFYLEGSQDDVTWTLIEGSRFDNVDTTNPSIFEWDKRPDP